MLKWIEISLLVIAFGLLDHLQGRLDVDDVIQPQSSASF